MKSVPGPRVGNQQLLYGWNQPLLLKQEFGNCPPRPTTDTKMGCLAQNE